MNRNRLKKVIAVAMSAAVAVTAVPNLPAGFTVKVEAASTFGSNTKKSVSIDNFLSENSGDEILSGDFKVQYKFTNKTKDSALNWNNYLVHIFNGTDGLIVRADNYAWFDGEWKDDGSEITYGAALADEAEFREVMKDASVTVTVERSGTRISVTNDIVSNNDASKSYQMTEVFRMNKLSDTLTVNLSGEKVDMTDISVVDKSDEKDEFNTSDTLEFNGWWKNFSYGDEITSDAKTIKFQSKSDANAIGNYHTPSLVVYYGDQNKVGCDEYEEVAVIRSDVWAWFYGNASQSKDALDGEWNKDDITFSADSYPDWIKWLNDNRNGVDVSVTTQIANGKATIIYENDGAKSTTTFKVKEGKKLYVALTGERCRVKGLSDSMMKLQTKPGNGMDADAVEIDYSNVSEKYKELFGEESKKSHVSVHDPSVVIGYTDEKYTGDSSQTVYGEQNEKNTRQEVYFIFGSHRAFAWSTDMQNWKNFENNINDDTQCQKLFESAFDWASKGDSKYDWTGNMWAPDVIWNDQMKKWCMYMSINGNSWNSSIVLLTSDSLNGDWTNEGTVVYSGFTKSGAHNYDATDFISVVGKDDVDTDIERFADSDSTWNSKYGAHAIDPCVTYDSDGNMWMSYGSWSGGIWMIKLDEATGLRDKTISYKYTDNESDPYMGYKLAGGNGVSGEASYIEKIGDKYYLFLSYGGLTATGGYNMRVFSSDDIAGPYKDVAGNDARDGKAGDANGTVGERLMSYYKWSYLDKGYVAQGHNSAVVDNDGKTYLVYHTRFNDGTESHEVRVHQLFTAKNGGLVTTPFEYSGETLSKTAYDKTDVAGDYNVILQKQSVSASTLECCKEEKITLGIDGKISGAYTGTWSQDSDAPYVTLDIDGVSYQGVFIKQKIEDTNCETMCFTTVGDNNVTFWGTKGYTDEAKVVKDANEISVTIPAKLYSDITLPKTTNNGSEIIWKSSDESALSTDGVRGDVTSDTKVTLTMTVKSGKYYTKKSYNTLVKADTGADYMTGLVGDYTFENGLRNESDTSQVGVAKTMLNGTRPDIISTSGRSGKVLKQYFGYTDALTTSYVQFDNPLKGKDLEGATVSLWVNRDDTDVWDAIWSFFDEDDSDGKSGRTYFTPNAYLGYNGTVGTNKWFDCNHPNTVTDLIKEKEWHHVTVSLGKDDFGIYIDGKLVSDKTNNVTYNSLDDMAYEEIAADMLKVISSSDNFYLGYGSWWGSAPVLMDNVKIYDRELSAADAGALYNAEKAQTGLLDDSDKQKEQAIKEASILYKTYNYDSDVAYTDWSSRNASQSLTIESDSSEAHKNYVQFAPENQNSRDAYTAFGNITLPDKYVVEFDSKLTAGNDQESQLALTTADYAKTNSKLDSTSYLWSINTTNSDEWTISGNGAADSKVTLAKGTWAHFKTTVDKKANTVKLEITDESGKTLAESEFAPESIADVKGLFYLSGRYNGVAGFDNVRIYESTNEYTVRFSPNFSDSTDTMTTQKFKLGTAQTLRNNTFGRENYKFMGWSTKSTGSVEYTDAQEITSDLAKADEVVVLYAVWQKSTSSAGSSSSSGGSGSSGAVSTPKPTVKPIVKPTTAPTTKPTTAPTTAPTAEPTSAPTAAPTTEPTAAPSTEPTTAPTTEPTAAPTVKPTKKPTATTKPSTKKKKMSVKKVTANKNAKKITGTLSVTGAKVTVKVGNAKAKKATVKGKTFTFKLSKKLKKNTKVVITITKSKYYTVKKTIKVK